MSHLLLTDRLCAAKRSQALRQDKLGYTPKDLPPIIDFAFRCWYKGSPQAVNDAHRAASEKGYRSQYRLHTTLAMKVILSVSMRAYAVSGPNEKEFMLCCNRILDKHFMHHKPLEYSNPKAKKMSMDHFWSSCRYFNDPNHFNSGAKNTDVLLRQLSAACDEVCGPIPLQTPLSAEAA